MEEFLSSYLSYIQDADPRGSEVPAIYLRWTAIIGLGAFLGRQYYIHHGHFKLYANMYGMLIGSAGTRKGTAIKLMRKLLEEAGYNKFAAERTSKEKFLLDLAGESSSELSSPEDLLDQNLFGSGDSGVKSDCEVFIAIDEFNDFIGNGNIEFISMLGNMWDYNGTYRNRIKTGKSVEIFNPTISIIGGNTPTGFSLAFPIEILGQGFFSRLLLIYGEPNGRKLSFPKPPSEDSTKRIIEHLQKIRKDCVGPAKVSAGAEKLFDRIYQTNFGINDFRFESYSNRRFSHLLKLSLIVSAARAAREISENDIIYANTILSHTERLMPKALGEFGRAKHSEVSHKIINFVESQTGVVKFKQIWKQVSNDLENQQQLGTLLQNLVAAEKLQQVTEVVGFLPNRRVMEYMDEGLYNAELLTAEERGMSL